MILYTTCFQEYAENGAIGPLLGSLRMIAHVKAVSATTKTAGLSRKESQIALSDQGNAHNFFI